MRSRIVSLLYLVVGDQSEHTSCHAVQQRVPERLGINGPSVAHYELRCV